MSAKEINFEGLELTNEESAQKRWTSREPNPTVQMSVRMAADKYDRFRALCKRERRTNGDMLVELIRAYESKG